MEKILIARFVYDIIYLQFNIGSVYMFGDNLRQIRKSHGLTQAQLADCLNVSASTIGMYEQGRREPDTSMLKKICKKFNISIDNLLGNLNTKNFENKDVNEVIDEITQTLRSQKGLMFKGKLMKPEDREKIADAIKIATAIAVANSNLNEAN